MLGKIKHLDVPNGRMVLAVSDGELNNSIHDGRGSNHSLNSLPSSQICGLASEKSVASWAVSFERLLQDPLGVEYFTEFLKKEYSEENINFWKACEKFHAISNDDSAKLLQESRKIYNEYLSSSSQCPVNVDQQALITEDMLETPSPDLFNAQQLQIFNLMKFDSYARFVKSPLYQDCMLAEVEGRPLPNFSTTNPVASCHVHASGAVKKNKLRAGKSLPVGIEGASLETVADKLHRRSFKKKDRKGHCKETLDSRELSSRRESWVSLNSNNSLELSLNSSLTSKSENEGGSTGSTDPEADIKSIKYCCVYLPDGTASLTAVKPGLTIRDMLVGVCEKRGYCLTDVKVFLVGNEEKALALDQECLVLTDQEVRLENRISFELQMNPMNKSIRVVSKPTKTIGEALYSILKKYGLENHEIVLTKAGQSHALDQKSSVNEVAGQKLNLEVVNFSDPKKAMGTTAEHLTKKHSTKEHREDKGIPMTEPYHRAKNEPHNGNQVSSEHRHAEAPHGKHKPHRHKYDIEGLVELLNKVQSSRADDQRGLLCKEDLVLPEFLKVPTDKECSHCSMANADESAVIITNVVCSLDLSQASESCGERNCSTNSISSAFKKECLAESQANTAKGVAPLHAGTHRNSERIPEVIVSDSASSHYTSAKKPSSVLQ
ncbi:regulator of G-protein signaling 14 L homeolog [Xenopus laevis]|uniref:MGC80558 protein n=1 Tax=Xenopus laevis TaxID=8355 RepID=Q6GPB2_XENLA|nr:regulator of G-protein signaling 14 L homeolog [Xenopus laevis]AAH73229.1 MGC80558 protein [Xenopus laevis]